MEIKRIQVESFRIPERAGLVWWAICEPETIHLHEASGRNKVIVKNRDLEAGAEKPDPVKPHLHKPIQFRIWDVIQCSGSSDGFR